MCFVNAAENHLKKTATGRLCRATHHEQLLLLLKHTEQGWKKNVKSHNDFLFISSLTSERLAFEMLFADLIADLNGAETVS